MVRALLIKMLPSLEVLPLQVMQTLQLVKSFAHRHHCDIYSQQHY